MSEQIRQVKIVLLGSTSVGKTCIINRIVSGVFSKDLQQTFGTNLQTKSVNINGIDTDLNIWDTAGQEGFRSLAPMYYRGSNIAVLVYSIDSKDSLKDLEYWVNELSTITSTKDSVDSSDLTKLIIIGNKVDLVDSREVLTENGMDFAKEVGAEFLEVSAFTGEGITELVEKLQTLSQSHFQNYVQTIKPNDQTIHNKGQCNC